MRKVILLSEYTSTLSKKIITALINSGNIVYSIRNINFPIEEENKVPKYLQFIEIDINNKHSIKKNIQKLISKEGKIDAFINNHDFCIYGGIENIDMEEARQQIEVSIFQSVQLIKSVLDPMRKHNNGRIINISSIMGKISLPFISWYNTSKHSIEKVCHSIQNDIEGFNIYISIVEKKFIAAEFDQINMNFPDFFSQLSPNEKIIYNLIEFHKKNYKNLEKNETVVKNVLHALSSKKPKSIYSVNSIQTTQTLQNIIGNDLWSKFIRNTMKNELQSN